MVKLDHRSGSKELMDDPRVDAGILCQTYQQIKSINRATLGHWPMMTAVKYFLSRAQGRPVKILDIGCGDGEDLRRIERYGLRMRLPLQLTGIDLSSAAVSAACRRTVSGKIRFIQGNVLEGGHREDYDFMVTSLTTHHLTEEEIVLLIRWMTEHSRMGWFISDLHRHSIAYYFIKYFVRVCRFNPLIRHDAPLSVARSFRRGDWRRLLARAGFHGGGAGIVWYPNFRYGIRYEKFI
jgi:SAM-dependent methyltransferase